MESVLKRAQEYAVEGANCFCQELTLTILHSERPKLCGVLAVLSATGLIGNGEKKVVAGLHSLFSVSAYLTDSSSVCNTYLHLQRGYSTSVVIRQSFLSFQNNPKNLDLSYKTDLGLWDCLGRVQLV